MNRWQGWAQRLRARHTRKAAGRAGALVLLRAHRACAPQPRPRASVHLHHHFSARFTFSAQAMLTRWARAAAPPLQRTSSSAPLSRHSAAPDATAPARDPNTPVNAPMTTPAHAPTTPVGAALPAAVKSIARPRLARRLPMVPALRGAAPTSPSPGRGAIALRLRSYGAREETKVAAPPVLLAAPRAQRSAAVVAQLRSDLDETRAAQAQRAPAMDVTALTGMVIEQIDRRMLAYRERMGRD